jgi:hypothetical protein
VPAADILFKIYPLVESPDGEILNVAPEPAKLTLVPAMLVYVTMLPILSDVKASLNCMPFPLAPVPTVCT